MSNLTTAGNLAVSQNVSIGGNLVVSGKLSPTGNLYMVGTFTTASYASFNGTTTFNGTVYFGTSQVVYLNSCPLFIAGDTGSYLSYEIGEDKIILAGNQGGSIGHTNTGPYTKLITWNTSNQVGINTTTPAYTLDVNGNANISGNTTTSGNISTTGDITTTSGNISTTLGNITSGNNITCGSYLFTNYITGKDPTNGVRLWHPTQPLLLQNDSTGNIEFMTTNTTGVSIFKNGNVYVGNTSTSSGKLIV